MRIEKWKKAHDNSTIRVEQCTKEDKNFLGNQASHDLLAKKSNNWKSTPIAT